MHRVLTPADYRETAWKNGGGRTTEVAARPEGADLAHFAWRISIAQVARDGPFSVFDGIDRTLVLLRGAGMRLSSDGASTLDIRAPFEPVAFPGEVAYACVLIDGPVHDFNLMIRRNAAHGRVDVVQGASGAVRPAGFRLCYVARGACECLLPGRAALRLPEHSSLALDAADGEPPATLHVNPLADGAVALVVSVDAAAPA
jgi:environmental stress-induced protein Ves